MCQFSTGRTEKFVESSFDPVMVLSSRNIVTSGLKAKMSSPHHLQSQEGARDQAYRAGEGRDKWELFLEGWDWVSVLLLTIFVLKSRVSFCSPS